jgi:hypothetical protein
MQFAKECAYCNTAGRVAVDGKRDTGRLIAPILGQSNPLRRTYRYLRQMAGLAMFGTVDASN